MALKVKSTSFAGQFLLYLFAAEEVLTSVITYRPKPYGRSRGGPIRQANRSTLYRLIESGLIEIVEDQGHEYYKLTKSGEMQALILKARVPSKAKWDGKWRLVVFDIPEDFSSERDQLRRLLLLNNFIKLQASVYLSPKPINRQAIAYLKETGLIKYIRFARIDELDDDKDLKKKFNL